MTGTPPAKPVEWVVLTGDPCTEVLYLGTVVAQFWSEARALASAKFGREPDELIVEAIVEEGM